MGCAPSHEAYPTTSDPNLRGGRAASRGNAEVLAAITEIEKKAFAAAQELLDANKGKNHRDTYVRATLTSCGASCKVFSCANKYTQQQVAIKTIPKSVNAPELQRQRVMQEIGCMVLLQQHPHAVKLLEVYEDEKNYHLVMELLKGGELFDHVSHAGRLTEAVAASVLHSLCLYIAHAHAIGIAHMDLKPENIMFDSEGAKGVLKVVDLGAAEFVGPQGLVQNAFGTVRYSSPEMAREGAGQKSDVWSAGVVVYQMLCGKVPFLKGTDVGTLSYIMKGPQVRFNGSVWRNISQAAKDCLQAMMRPNPRDRPTAAQVLAMPWLVSAADAPQQALDASIVKQLQLFGGMSRGRRLMLGVAASSLSGQEASKLLKQFLAADVDFNGTLCLEELALAAKQAAPEVTDEELKKVFDALDVDNTGTVDASEFIAGVIHVLNPAITNNVFEASFKRLDRTSQGFLTKEQFKESLALHTAASMRSQLSEEGLQNELDAEFDAMDLNRDGLLTLEEYQRALSPTGVKSNTAFQRLATA